MDPRNILPPGLTLALEENALDSLKEGVQRLASARGGYDLKHAILHVAHAVELFLKARLAREESSPFLVETLHGSRFTTRLSCSTSSY